MIASVIFKIRNRSNHISRIRANDTQDVLHSLVHTYSMGPRQEKKNILENLKIVNTSTIDLNNKRLSLLIDKNTCIPFTNIFNEIPSTLVN